MLRVYYGDNFFQLIFKQNKAGYVVSGLIICKL